MKKKLIWAVLVLAVLGVIYLFARPFVIPAVIFVLLTMGTMLILFFSNKGMPPNLSIEQQENWRLEKKLKDIQEEEKFQEGMILDVKKGRYNPWKPDYGKITSWIFVGLVVIGVSAILYKPLTEAIAKIPQPTQAPEAFIPTSEPVFCQRPVGENQDLWVDINSEDRQPGDRCDGVIVEIPTPIAPIQVVETQVVTATAPSTQYFTVWVRYGGQYGKAGGWSQVSEEGKNMYTMVLDDHPCGVPASFSEDVIAIVTTTELVYGAEVLSDLNSVTVMCSGTVDFVKP